MKFVSKLLYLAIMMLFFGCPPVEETPVEDSEILEQQEETEITEPVDGENLSQESEQNTPEIVEAEQEPELEENPALETEPVETTPEAEEGGLETPPIEVERPLSSEKQLNAVILPELGLSVQVGGSGEIPELLIPYSLSMTGIEVQVVHTGESLELGGRITTGESFRVDGPGPHQLVIVAEDMSTRDYQFTLGYQDNPKSITRFTVGNDFENVEIDESGSQITFSLLFGESLASLVPDFDTDLFNVSAGGEQVIPGQTSLDFSNPVEFLLTDTQGRTRIWSVNATNRAASDNAQLQSLTAGEFVLSPFFTPEVFGYTIFVNNLVDNIRINAVASHEAATMELRMNSDPSIIPVRNGIRTEQLILQDGTNVLYLKVLAEDQRTSNFYLINVERID